MAFKMFQQSQPPSYIGTSADALPDHTDNLILTGTRAIEADTKRKWLYDGSTWVEHPRKYYITDRIGVPITSTLTTTYSAGTITKYGEVLRQIIVTCAAATAGSVTRHLTMTDANGVNVFQTTEFTGGVAASSAISSVITYALVGQGIMQGTYTLSWTLSAPSESTTVTSTGGMTDYISFAMERGDWAGD